jgi:hypothetical protein
MNRRTLLSRTVAAGAALSLAGCLRSGGEEDVLSISDSKFEADEDGNLVVVIVVSNPSDREASGTLYVNSELNDQSLTRVREVSLQPHSTTTVEVTYDTKYENISSFSYNTDLVEE